jgi:hypothetical protein
MPGRELTSGSMNQTELMELLNAHAEGLRDGVDLTEELIAKKPDEDQRTLMTLLRLARRVQAALAPVEPRPAFVSDLRAQLQGNIRNPHRVTKQSREIRRKWLGLAAGLAAIIYVMGLFMVNWRLSLTMLSLIAGFLGGRVARPSAPRIRASH